MAEGYDVKQSEVHGMSQRGGSVTSHLRFGDKVWLVARHSRHGRHLLAFESVEALRYVHWLRPGGLARLQHTCDLTPSPVSAGWRSIPQAIDERIAAAWPNVRALEANALASRPAASNPPTW